MGLMTGQLTSGCGCDAKQPIGTFDCKSKDGTMQGEFYGFRNQCDNDLYRVCLMTKNGILRVLINNQCTIILKTEQVSLDPTVAEKIHKQGKQTLVEGRAKAFGTKSSNKFFPKKKTTVEPTEPEKRSVVDSFGDDFDF
jgi:hypothetical protein